MFKTDTDKMSVWTFAKTKSGGPRELSKVLVNHIHHSKLSFGGQGQGAKVRQLEKTIM